MSEKKKQILRDAVKTFGSRMIKLGADGGSGFFFVGSTDLLREKAGEYDQELRTAAKNSAAVYKKSAECIASNAPTLASYIAAAMRDEAPKPTLDDYLKTISAWMNACVKKELAYRSARDRADNYQSLMERDVVRIQECDKIVDEGILIVIVRGGERGKYWISSEANGEPFGLVGDTEDDEDETA